MLNFDSKVVESLKPVDLFRSMLTAAMPGPGRYSSRFRICAAFVEWYCLIRSQRLNSELLASNKTYFLRRSCYFIPAIVSETLNAATSVGLVAVVNRERQSFRL